MFSRGEKSQAWWPNAALLTSLSDLWNSPQTTQLTNATSPPPQVLLAGCECVLELRYLLFASIEDQEGWVGGVCVCRKLSSVQQVTFTFIAPLTFASGLSQHWNIALRGLLKRNVVFKVEKGSLVCC